jgi:hypothetical protein
VVKKLMRYSQRKRILNKLDKVSLLKSMEISIKRKILSQK